MVGVTGFEPATSYTQNRRATRLRYTPSPLRYPVFGAYARAENENTRRLWRASS